MSNQPTLIFSDLHSFSNFMAQRYMFLTRFANKCCGFLVVLYIKTLMPAVNVWNSGPKSVFKTWQGE